MAGQWVSDNSNLPITNFDDDTDIVTGGTGAREDLKYLIEQLNIILASIDEGAIPYTDLHKDTIAFKDVTNTFTLDQKISGAISVARDLTSDQSILNVYNTNYAILKWQHIVSSTVSGNTYILRAGGVDKLQIDYNAQALNITATGVTFGGQSIQMQPIVVPIYTTYSIARMDTTLIHGQSTKPTFTTVKLRCIVADLGYTPGMEIDYNATVIHQTDNSPNNTHSGLSVIYPNNTQLRIVSPYSGIPILRLDTNTMSTATVYRWVIDTYSYWW